MEPQQKPKARTTKHFIESRALHSESEKNIDLSIIIVSLNTKDLLQQCLQSIDETTHKTVFEIWVIDNGSTDGSVEMIMQKFPAVRLIRNDSNLGFAKANNLGIRASRGRYVCLINSDVVVLNHCLDQMHDYMEQNPTAGMIAPKILNSDMTLQISCYGSPNFWNSLCHALGMYKIFPQTRWLAGTYRKYWPYDTTRSVDAISGCFCMARREAIGQAGLLDENFFMYMEDFDWCKRVREAGWEVFYFPGPQAIHFGGGSTGNASAKYMIERNRAMLHYWHKHYGRMGKSYMMLLILLRQILRALHGVFWYLLKPSDKFKALPIIKESVASVQWLLHLSK